MTSNQLVKARSKKGTSQFALAAAAKVSRFRIQQFENGYAPLTEEEKNRINKALKKQEK